MLVVMTIVLGVAYPLAVWGIGQVAFSWHARTAASSTVDGEPVGSSLIGQAFDGPEWFIGRPDAFDPSASAPSNLGPSNPALGDAVRERLDAVTAADEPRRVGARRCGHGQRERTRPPYLARIRTAAGATGGGGPRARPSTDVLALIDAHTEGRTSGFLGEPRVNVLLLNLALEGLASGS